MKQESTYVGIDVAKAQVDVAVRPTGQTWTITYDDAGIQELVSQLKTLEPALGVCPRIRSWRRKPPRNNLLTVIWTLSWSN